jgi:hypothetical protein
LGGHGAGGWLNTILRNILEVYRVTHRSGAAANTSKFACEAGRRAVDGGEALLGSMTVNVTAPVAGNRCLWNW